jgi:hypothetical protein
MLIGLLSLSFTAAAQYDAGGQNTHGADLDPGRLDPAAKARLRTEGAVGGIQGGLKTEAQKEGDASAGASSKDTGKQGRVANETSSDREAARGARGGSAKEDSAAQK